MTLVVWGGACSTTLLFLSPLLTSLALWLPVSPSLNSHPVQFTLLTITFSHPPSLLPFSSRFPKTFELLSLKAAGGKATRVLFILCSLSPTFNFHLAVSHLYTSCSVGLSLPSQPLVPHISRCTNRQNHFSFTSRCLSDGFYHIFMSNT